jgi:hypothetical protein
VTTTSGLEPLLHNLEKTATRCRRVRITPWRRR